MVPPRVPAIPLLPREQGSKRAREQESRPVSGRAGPTGPDSSDAQTTQHDDHLRHATRERPARRRQEMNRSLKFLTALSIAAVALLFIVKRPAAKAAEDAATTSPVMAIDIVLEPDQTMIDHAQAANERLRKDFPKGFALDATHHPHI